MRRFIGITASAAIVTACGSTVPVPSLEDAQQTVPALATAFSACDFEMITSLYSETAEFLAPDTPKPVLGREAVVEHLKGACTASFSPVMEVLEQRLSPLGSHGAVVSGRYSLGRSDQAPDTYWPASYVITLVHTDGGWRIQTQATFPGAT